MNDTELKKVYKYLNSRQRQRREHSEKLDSFQMYGLIPLADNKLYEEVLTRKYQYEEFTIKRKRIRRRHFSPNALAEIKCTGKAYTERLRTLQISRNSTVCEVEIVDPGNEIFKEIQLRCSSSHRGQRLPKGMEEITFGWKTVGLRFGHRPSHADNGSELCIDMVNRMNPGTEALMRGDRILAIEGIVFDEQTVDILNRDSGAGDYGCRTVPVAVTTLYEIMTSLLDAWIKNNWPNQSGSHRRPALRLTIARIVSTDPSVTPLSEFDYTSLPGVSHCRSSNGQQRLAKIQVAQLLLGPPQWDSLSQPEEEPIDPSKTNSQSGVFLVSTASGLHPGVELQDEDKVFRQHDHPESDEDTVHLKESVAMNRTTTDTLHFHRGDSNRAEFGPPAPSESSFHPVRLVLSRSSNRQNYCSPQTPVTLPLIASPIWTPLEAMAVPTDVAEERRNQPAPSAKSPTVGADEANFPEEKPFVIHLGQSPVEAFISEALGVPLAFLNLGDRSGSGVVVEEELEDERGAIVLEATASLGDDEGAPRGNDPSPPTNPVSELYQAYPAQGIDIELGGSRDSSLLHPEMEHEKRALLRTRWLTQLKDDVDVIIGAYTLPAVKSLLGISVETLASIDAAGQETGFRHRLVEVAKEGVIARQTELKPMDEILEVNGVTVMGKDGTFLTSALQESRTSGYLVCSRPINKASERANHPRPDDTTRMSASSEASPSEATGRSANSTEIESDTGRPETALNSANKIAELRRGYERSPREVNALPSKALADEKAKSVL